MSDRIIGILGGMGPEATSDLYREIIDLTPANKDQDHIPVLIYSNTAIPDRTSAILGSGENPLPHLVHSARVLESAGAGILAIPCNTAHYFLPELQRSVSVPILNMILETLRALQKSMPDSRTVGLLASRGTVESGIYRDAFLKRSIRILAPDATAQDRVSMAIHQIKAGIISTETRDTLMSAAADMVAAGAEATILGCTEIPLAMDESALGHPCLNATRILAQAAVDWALGRRD